jgi:hypothetical protein
MAVSTIGCGCSAVAGSGAMRRRRRFAWGRSLGAAAALVPLLAHSLVAGVLGRSVSSGGHGRRWWPWPRRRPRLVGPRVPGHVTAAASGGRGLPVAPP